MIPLLQANGVGAIFGFIFWGIIIIIVLSLALKIIFQYQRGVRFTLGKYSGVMGPGLNFLIPFIQTYQRVDMRIKTIDVPKQEVMTKDNVPVKINAVVFFRVNEPTKAIIEVQDYIFATAQLAQTALRDVLGAVSLDSVLTRRDELAQDIKEIVDKATDPWGIDVTGVRMQDVELPQDLKRTMAKQAEAERERRSTIIKAEGEVVAANNLAKAAKTLYSSPGALHLRTLNTLNDLSSDQSNTVVFAIPIEVLDAIKKLSMKK